MCNYLKKYKIDQILYFIYKYKIKDNLIENFKKNIFLKIPQNIDEKNIKLLR